MARLVHREAAGTVWLDRCLVPDGTQLGLCFFQEGECGWKSCYCDVLLQPQALPAPALH